MGTPCRESLCLVVRCPSLCSSESLRRPAPTAAATRCGSARSRCRAPRKFPPPGCLGWDYLSNASYLSNAALFVFYGITCLTRLVDVATLFATFEETMRWTSSVRQAVPPDSRKGLPRGRACRGNSSNMLHKLTKYTLVIQTYLNMLYKLTKYSGSPWLPAARRSTAPACSRGSRGHPSLVTTIITTNVIICMCMFMF